MESIPSTALLRGHHASPVAAVLPHGMPRHKVLLVEDHDLVRLGVKALFSAPEWDGIEWVEAATLADALQLHARHDDIELVLLDLNLADCKGLNGLAQMLAEHPEARVLILSGTQDEFVVRQAKAMGAAGYLHKSGSPETMRETLWSILQHEPPCGAGARAPQHFPKFPSASSYDRVAELGARHLEILELVLSGCANQEISNSTKLSLGTVKNYVSTILLALDVKSRSHLISLFR
ncbi:MAG TPA: response regulator transcription factor [Burkholderiaceae bacterium]